MDYHTRAFICDHIFTATRPILLVTHEEDGAWQLLCGDVHDFEVDSCRIAGIGHLLDRDPSVSEVLDLPLGHEAERSSVTGPWVRAAIVDER